MMKSKKIPWPLKILFGLFVVFVALFIANLSGYYESKIRENVVLTEEAIKEFESLVQSGEEIDLSSFLTTEREDYSNFASNLGENVTSNLKIVISKWMSILRDILKSLF